MKLLHIILIALVSGFIGGLASQLLMDPPVAPDGSKPGNIPATPNPFEINFSPEEEPDNSLSPILAQIDQLEVRLDALEAREPVEQQSIDVGNTPGQAMANRPARPNQQNLVDAGLSPDAAADLLRRMGEQEYRRLQLQSLISRSQGDVRKQYQDELRELNRNRLSLRSELGESRFNRFLYSSGQNNRMRVTSVLSGSPAEAAGLNTGDILLRYDGKNIASWSDIRRLTQQGDFNNFTSIDILRDSAVLNLTVQRGPLGVQMEPARVDPEATQ